MKQRIQLGGTYDERTSKILGSMICQNWTPVQTMAEGKPVISLIQRDGLELETTLGVGPHRGSYEHDGKLYIVSGNTVTSLDTTGTYTTVGTLNTYYGQVGMASSGSQLVIVDGTDGWYWNGSAFTQITDVDFVEAQQVCFLHGRFIVNSPGTGRFYISASYDASSWAALDYATAQVDPDDLVGLVTTMQDLILFGTYTAELYFDSGNSTFPFEPNPGGAMDYGCVARWSIAKGNNSVYWLGQNRNGKGYVIRAKGLTPEIISTDAIQEKINTFSDMTDAIGHFCKFNNQHSFYVLTFPTGNHTFVYDVQTGMWHTWTYGTDRFIGSSICFFNNKTYVGSRLDGKLYSFSATKYTDDGEYIRRKARTVKIASDQDRLTFPMFQVKFQHGAGISTGQGSDPQAILKWSNDGGYTWGNEHWRGIGQIGEYSDLCIWRSTGQARDRVYELAVTDPIRADIEGAYVEFENG